MRRSILFDSKADLLVYGLAEETIADVTNVIAAGREAKRPWADVRAEISRQRGIASVMGANDVAPEGAIELAAYEVVSTDKAEYARVSRKFHLETNPLNARTLVQFHAEQAHFLLVNEFLKQERNIGLRLLVQMDVLHNHHGGPLTDKHILNVGHRQRNGINDRLYSRRGEVSSP